MVKSRKEIRRSGDQDAGYQEIRAYGAPVKVGELPDNLITLQGVWFGRFFEDPA
jgi:hypothetical protein